MEQSQIEVQLQMHWHMQFRMKDELSILFEH